MGFWEGFSDGFFRESDRAVQRERQRVLDEREKQRFQWEQDREAQAAGIRRQRQQLATDMQYGAVDRASVDPQVVAQQAGMEPQQVQALSRGAFDAMQGPAVPGAARRPLAQADVADRVGALALAEGNYAGAFQAQDRARIARTDDGRRAEFKRLSALKDDELAKIFEPTNADGSGVPAMVDFDPKTRRFLMVSRVPGVPSQTLSRAELLQGLMGAWEAGNGDYAAGIQALVANAQNQRALEGQAFERSTKLAGMNADAYFKGQAADNDRARTGIAARSAASQASALRMGAIQHFQDEQGNVRSYVPVATREGMSFQEVRVPEGMRPFRPAPAVSPEVVVGLAGNMVGQPTGRLINGKPELHTAETAVAAARRALSGGQAGGVTVDTNKMRLPGEEPAPPKPATAPSTPAPAFRPPTASALDPAASYLRSEYAKTRGQSAPPAQGPFPALGARPLPSPPQGSNPAEIDPNLLRLLNGG